MFSLGPQQTCKLNIYEVSDAGAAKNKTLLCRVNRSGVVVCVVN